MRAGNFGTGFIQGYNTADTSIARRRALDLQEDRLAEASKRSDQRQAIAEQQLDIMRTNSESLNAHRDSQRDISERQLAIQEGNAAAAEKHRGWERAQAEDAVQYERFQSRAQAHIQNLLNGGDYDAAFEDDLEAAGLPHLTARYYLKDPTRKSLLALQPVLRNVAQGNFADLNNPQVLQHIHNVYADQIEVGAGELSESSGKRIVGKSLAGLDAAPGGQGVVATLAVTYEDGTTDRKPITLHRTSADGDPVRVLSMADMFDDVTGRVRLAEIFEQPEVRQSLNNAYGQIAGTGSGQDLPSDARMIEYLMAGGIDRDEAVRMVMDAARNPSSELTRIFVALKSGDFSERSVEELAQEARRVHGMLQTDGGASAAPGSDFPDEDIQRVLDANKGKDRAWAVRYLQHLRSQGQY